MTSPDASRPARPPELFRFEDDANRVSLRIDSLDRRDDGTVSQALGTIEVDCGDLSAERGVRAVLPTFVADVDLNSWQESLDSLDLGHDIAWRENQRADEVHVRWEGDDRLVVTVRDRMGLLISVTAAVQVSDAWFDDAYDRLARVYELFEGE